MQYDDVQSSDLDVCYTLCYISCYISLYRFMLYSKPGIRVLSQINLVNLVTDKFTMDFNNLLHQITACASL